jgi:diguanylate cyclase (GGDEF)-like protein
MSTRRSPRPRPTLRQVFYRGHLKVALAAVCIAGVAVAVIGVLTLRVYAENNLRLVARSIAYTAEAAVMFEDSAATEEALRLIASAEDISQASVYGRNGRLLASWTPSSSDAEQRLADWLLPSQSILPIVRDGTEIGAVHLQGSGSRLLSFLVKGLAGMLAALLLTAVGAFYLSRRLVARIAGPLDQLAQVAHVARLDRNFVQRVRPAPIRELNGLGEDFNALLGELQAWQAHLENENASLAHKANHDSLTNLPNRAFFEGRLSRTLREIAGHAGHAAVLFIDSDRFKSINDQLGHAAGDAVLMNIAARIRSQLREHDLVARLGGDEFAVLLAPLADSEDATRIADDILASMHSPIHLPDGTSINTSLTIGIALYPEHAHTPETLLHCADSAMYHAKREARGTRRVADRFKH